MLYVVDIIPARVWVHADGRKASTYGAAPWLTDADRQNWRMETRGYTFMMNDGTVGMGQKPAPTYEDAVRRANTFNRRLVDAGAVDVPLFG